MSYIENSTLWIGSKLGSRKGRRVNPGGPCVVAASVQSDLVEQVASVAIFFCFEDSACILSARADLQKSCGRMLHSGRDIEDLPDLLCNRQIFGVVVRDASLGEREQFVVVWERCLQLLPRVRIECVLGCALHWFLRVCFPPLRYRNSTDYSMTSPVVTTVRIRV